MPDMKVFLELIAKSDKFQQGFQQGERALGSFRTHVQNTMQKVQQLTANFGVLGQAAAALSSGLVIKKLFSISDYMPIDDALLRMRVNLKANSAEMDILKNKIAAFAGKEGQDIGQSFQVANKLSLNFKQDDILQIMKTADKVSKATNEPLEITSASMVEMIKLFKIPKSEYGGLGDALITSRINMEQLDTVMQRLALHGGGKKDFIESLGMIRGLGMAGIDKTRSIVALNNVLDMINNKGFILEQHGIKVKGRSQLEVLTDLQTYINKMRKTHTEAENLKQYESFFGAGGKEAMDFVFAHMKDFQKGIDEMGNASKIATDRASAGAETWENQLNRIKGSLGGIKTDLSTIYDLAKKPVKVMADHPTATKAAGYTAAGVSAAVIGYLAYSTIKKIFTSGNIIKDVLTSGPFGKITGPVPVYVVNKRMSLIDLPNTVKDSNLPGKIAKVGSGLGFLGTGFTIGAVATIVSALGISAYEINKARNAKLGDPSRMAGEGGVMGAGTISKAFEELFSYIFHREKPEVKPVVKNTINLKFDKDMRLYATGDSGTDFKININRGAFFEN
jgi:hypothetical protein